MKMLMVTLVMSLIIGLQGLQANTDPPEGYRLLLYIDRSGSIPDALYVQALGVVSDELTRQGIVFGAKEIVVRPFDDQLSLIVLDEQVFKLPVFSRDSVVAAVQKVHGLVGVGASRAYEEAVAECQRQIGDSIAAAAAYIRRIESRKASMTDIAGLLDHLTELRPSDRVLVISDLQDENDRPEPEHPPASGRITARVVCFYVPSQTDLNDAKEVRNTLAERKQKIESFSPAIAVLPLRSIAGDWSALLETEPDRSVSAGVVIWKDH